jgi:hypothetical protein
MPLPPPGCQALSTDASDHCPLFLQTNMTFSPKPRFHFEVFWPKFSDYQDALKRGWQCSGNSSDPIRRLDALFKNLASELKSWSARRIGIIKEQLIMAREIILRLDQASDQRQLTQQEAALRGELKRKCLGVSSLERTFARQWSRVRYLAEGDANTKYFHLIARGRKRRNLVPSLTVNGVLLSAHEDMSTAYLIISPKCSDPCFK